MGTGSDGNLYIPLETPIGHMIRSKRRMTVLKTVDTAMF